MKITSKERNESLARADVDIFNPTRECSYTTHVVNNCLCIHNQIHRHPRGPTHHPNGTTDARMDWIWIWIRLGDRPLDARRERNEPRTTRRFDRIVTDRFAVAIVVVGRVRNASVVSTSFATSRSRSEEDGRGRGTTTTTTRENTRDGGRKIFLRRIRTHLDLGRLERGDAADEGGSEERGHSRYLGDGVRAGVRTGVGLRERRHVSMILVLHTPITHKFIPYCGN